MAFNPLEGIGSLKGGLNVGGLLSGNPSISGTFNSLLQKDKIANKPNSPIKELYAPTTPRTYQYPLDLDTTKYIMFQAQKRVSPLGEDTKPGQTTSKGYATIILPIPTQVKDDRSVSYSNSPLGILGGIGAGDAKVGQVLDDVKAGLSNFASAGADLAAGNFSDLGRSLSSASTLGNIGTLAATSALGTIGMRSGWFGVAAITAAATKLAQGAAFAQGIAYNPRMAVLFEGVQFREFNFSYRLIARNQTESENIRNIIQAFQHHMAPRYFNDQSEGGTSKLGFNYPDEFIIEFAQPLQSTMFKFQPCVLKDVSVTYNGESGPAFFDVTNEPVIVDLSLNFQETVILTQDVVDSMNAITWDAYPPTAAESAAQNKARESAEQRRLADVQIGTPTPTFDSARTDLVPGESSGEVYDPMQVAP